MPIPDQFKDLVESLTILTNQRRVNWTISEVQRNVVCFIRGQNTIQIEILKLPQSFGTIMMRILNSDGQRVDGFEVTEGEAEWNNLHTLYKEARRKAMNADDVIADIAGDLRGKLKDGGQIGD